MSQVMDHAAVDDIREVTLEDPAGLLLGVLSVGACLGVDLLGAWLAAQLRDGHPVKDRVDAAVVAMADGLAGAFGGRGGQRRGGR